MKLMVASDPKHVVFEDLKTYYTSESKITSFHKHVILFCSGNEDEVILEACFVVERVNTVAFDDRPSLYFYL